VFKDYVSIDTLFSPFPDLLELSKKNYKCVLVFIVPMSFMGESEAK
jgi:hypothetical protein